MHESNKRPTLAGKTALVTGGSRGIGAAIVRRLAQEGASVAFTYASSAGPADALRAEVAALDVSSFALKADSASVAALQQAVAEAADRLGGLDIFVNNAGILRVASVEAVTLEDLEQLMAVNIRAAYLGVQSAVKRMRDGGRVIVIGSSAAERIAFPGISAYSMTKAALQGMVRGMAVDLAPRRITVNNVQPGPIATDINPAEGETAELLQNMILLKRYGTDVEVASMVAYLASPEAGFITGANLTVDGGYSV